MDERTVIITGASDGIGAAAAGQLAAQCDNVVLIGRSAEKTSTLARRLGVAYHVADFADLRQVRQLAAALLDAYPRIDVLANNAGGLMRCVLLRPAAGSNRRKPGRCRRGRSAGRPKPTGSCVPCGSSGRDLDASFAE
nr:SDR family NAD(P)-dependent oxidoreductase [Actinoplanes auranticolor]